MVAVIYEDVCALIYDYGLFHELSALDYLTLPLWIIRSKIGGAHWYAFAPGTAYLDLDAVKLVEAFLQECLRQSLCLVAALRPYLLVWRRDMLLGVQAMVLQNNS